MDWTYKCRLLFSQASTDLFVETPSFPPFSCPSSLEYLRPRALILLKTWRYISRLLTYLLTYLHYCESAITDMHYFGRFGVTLA